MLLLLSVLVVGSKEQLSRVFYKDEKSQQENNTEGENDRKFLAPPGRRDNIIFPFVAIATFLGEVTKKYCNKLQIKH